MKKIILPTLLFLRNIKVLLYDDTPLHQANFVKLAAVIPILGKQPPIARLVVVDLAIKFQQSWVIYTIKVPWQRLVMEIQKKNLLALNFISFMAIQSKMRS